MLTLVIGANSDIARALIDEMAANGGSDFILASRNVDALNAFAQDLKSRHQVQVTVRELDVLDFDQAVQFHQSLTAVPDCVIYAAGLLSQQAAVQDDFALAHRVIETNYVAAVNLLELFAKDFELRKSGHIIGVSSIAGVRGRQNNYIYGSSKAAFTAYLSGLRNRLAKLNIPVLTVIPGYVATKMTADKNTPKILTATPEQVGKDIYRAMRKRKNTVYTLWFWRPIMWLVKSLPECIFKRTNF
jgi:short-subunit dehydrogenase